MSWSKERRIGEPAILQTSSFAITSSKGFRLPVLFYSLAYRFFALQGEKTICNKDKVPCCRRLKECE
jgi:hypothetical protein